MKVFIYMVTCLVTFLYPFFFDGDDVKKKQAEYSFMKTFQHYELTQVKMSKSESDFYANFPGATGYHNVNGKPGESVFFRYTEEPTRMLHSAEGCYKASGLELEFRDNVLIRVAELSDEKLQWSQFNISENGKQYLIRQCIISLTIDKAYADVPAWYWQTMFSSDDPGPWLAVTWKLPEPQVEAIKKDPHG